MHTTNATERLVCDLTDEELKVCSLTDLFAPKTNFSTVLAIPFSPYFNSSSIFSLDNSKSSTYLVIY